MAKGVESLPLRYIIIALVAALVVGIALQFTGILRSGTIGTAEKLNKTLTEKTICELDEEEPQIVDWNITCNSSTNTVNVHSVKVTDDCGVEWVKIEFYSNGTYYMADLVQREDDIWWSNGDINFSDPSQVSQKYIIQPNDTVIIWAKDKSRAENYKTFPTVKCG